MIFLMMPLVVFLDMRDDFSDDGSSCFLETLDDFSDDASSCFPRYA